MFFFGRKKGNRRSGKDRRIFSDRRKHKRFKAKPGVFALIRDHARKQHQIVDIGEGGLSINYMYKDREDISFSSFELDIFTIDRNFNLKNVPFKTVWDSGFSEGTPYETMRRRGMKFLNLTPAEQSHLELLIQNLTVEEA